MTGAPYRTTVYIDGFNFYYGQVRGTQYKWLNPETLFHHLLGTQNRVTSIKYFTARVSASARDPAVAARQDSYLRALTAVCPTVELHYGHFLRHKYRMEHANPPPAQVEVWKNEEKGSDVNLALHLLNDAWLGNFDCAVVVSNDSDVAEALRLVKTHHKKLIGLVTPGAPERKTSGQLRQHADFVKTIRTWMLRDAQLPALIPGTKLYKPATW
jgi:hypothetical protein